MTGVCIKFNTGLKWSNLFAQPEVVLRLCCNFSITYTGTYPEWGFVIGQPVWDPKFLSQINEKVKFLT